MTAAVRTLVPVVYVSELEPSVAFYTLLGFGEVSRGDDGEWAWSYLRRGELGILLAVGGAPLDARQRPAIMYCQTDDAAGLQQRLAAAGAPVEHLGYPDHAPGGELRTTDPDGHGILVGQTTGAPRVEPAETREPDRRSSILQRAADAVRRRGGTDHRCQIGAPGGAPCAVPAEVKLTDSWGDTAWSCLRHADEVVVNAPGVYLATEDAQGLGEYLARRRRPIRPELTSNDNGA